MVAGDDDITVSCCIAGCGPAGAMLGLLLARAGVDVLVLEKHGDFLRDFRGDTIHPSTLEVVHELGLLDTFMPQWDFLDFLARQAAAFPTFQLRMRAEATDLLKEDSRVVGLTAVTPDG